MTKKQQLELTWIENENGLRLGPCILLKSRET